MGTRRTQDRILEEALQLFNDRGTAAVAMHQIAAAAGLSRSNLLYHFHSKREIVLTLFQQLAAGMDADWYEDHRHASLEHMAGMYLRQFEQVVEYRFLFRELPALLRNDPLLAHRYQQNRIKRTAELVRYFRALCRTGVLACPAGRIESLVDSTWILCDCWPNHLEIQGRQINLDTVLEGYSAVIGLLSPYLVAAPDQVVADAKSCLAAAVNRPLPISSRPRELSS